MFRRVCPKPSMHIYAATCPDLGFIHSVQLMAIIWPANWLLRDTEKLQKYAEHPWLYPILHSHSMDGRSTAEPSWRMFAISYNFIFSIDILGIFVEEEPWITRSSCFKPSRLVSAGNDEFFLFLQTSDSVCLS